MNLPRSQIPATSHERCGAADPLLGRVRRCVYREVTSVSSAGFRVIVQAAKRAKASKGDITIFRTSNFGRTFSTLAALGTIIPIASDETEAHSKLAM